MLLFTPLKYGFYLINIFFISFFDFNKIKIVKHSIVLWFLLLIIEIIIPEVHNILFFRDVTLMVDRGFNSFGPEPATTGFFAMSFFLLFKDKLDIKYKILVSIVIFATFNFPIILSYILILAISFIRTKRFSFKSIFYNLLLIGVFFIIAYSNKNSFPPRFNLMLNALLEKDIYSFFLNDTSIQNRFNQIFNIFENQNGLSKKINSSGLPVLFNYYGVLSWFVIIYIVYKIKFSFNKIVVFAIFLFTGSLAHYMPLKFLLSKNEKNNCSSSSLQR